MSSDVITFPLPEHKSEPIAYGCSMPCWTAMEYGTEICDYCPNTEPEPPEAA